jgi:hypothetical protein
LRRFISMPQVDHFKLRFGPYKTPRFRYGQTATCLMRGKVKITGLTDAPIPWPTCQPRSTQAIILFGALARAVRRESNQAVARAWGVSGQTVTKWRKALGVDKTEGTTALRIEMGTHEPWAKRAQKAMKATLRNPERGAKISAALRGKAKSAVEAKRLRTLRAGHNHSNDTRRKMSAAHKARGTRVAGTPPDWTPEQDELVRTLPAAEAARRTGRSVAAIHTRWQRLGLPDRRASSMRAPPKLKPNS